MAHWKRGDKAEAARFFQQGVDLASSQSVGSELRMFRAEVDELLGKPRSRGRDCPQPALNAVQEHGDLRSSAWNGRDCATSERDR